MNVDVGMKTRPNGGDLIITPGSWTFHSVCSSGCRSDGGCPARIAEATLTGTVGMRRSVTSKMVVLLIILPWIFPTYADKWLPPKPATYESHRSTYRLTVFPAQQEADVAQASRGASRLGSDASPRCEAVLERLDASGRRYEQVWRKPLINVVAPVSALVSDADGSFVTFDNWGRMGWGDDVIVLYSLFSVGCSKEAVCAHRHHERLGRQETPAHRQLRSLGWTTRVGLLRSYVEGENRRCGGKFSRR